MASRNYQDQILKNINVTARLIAKIVAPVVAAEIVSVLEASF